MAAGGYRESEPMEIAIIDAQKQRIAEQRQEIIRLLAEVQRLEAYLREHRLMIACIVQAAGGELVLKEDDATNLPTLWHLTMRADEATGEFHFKVDGPPLPGSH